MHKEVAFVLAVFTEFDVTGCGTAASKYRV
jgi:hypothetical protein